MATKRVQYVKVIRGYVKYVIADFDDDGGADFADQEVGEMCWRPFVPSAEEKRAALQLCLQGGGQGWFGRLVVERVGGSAQQ